ncbi:hypothetical protein RsTz2092_06250 [Deferribacterales bacterium RsTz2092]
MTKHTIKLLFSSQLADIIPSDILPLLLEYNTHRLDMGASYER